MPWSQNYDPLNNQVYSTLLAFLPLVVLLGSLAFLRLKAHMAALLGLAAALLLGVLALHMPLSMAAAATLYGAAYGFLPIGWIILNVIFLYRLTVKRGLFKMLQESLTGITQDRRLQLLLIAFGIGAFFEGAAGFGAPVAVTSTLLIGIGFSPLAASGLSLLANTAPVAYGGLGTPVVALQGVTGLDLVALSGLIGRQLAFLALLIPFWLIWTFAGFRGMLEVWPALLVSGVSFSLTEWLVSSFHGPWLVDVAAAVVSILALLIFLRVWQPRNIWRFPSDAVLSKDGEKLQGAGALKAWLPWLILTAWVFVWGLPQVKVLLDHFTAVSIAVPGLHLLALRTPPVVPAPRPESAVFTLSWLSATGTGILLSALVSGWLMDFSLKELVQAYGETLKEVRFSLLTISTMMAIGFVSRYAGLDAMLGLAFARTGALYPFFAPLLGWLGVALTGSDTSSNVLFGSMQVITGQQVGVSPLLLASANSTGGVMGKMIATQSIVVASTATQWYGHEGDILRYVFWHSLALAAIVGIFILLQAYVVPFSYLVAH